MSTRFRDKYRIESLRIAGYNYTRAAIYYVTICTRKKKPFFGDLVLYDKNSSIHENLVLNQAGMIASGCWDELPEHFGNIELDEFVIMPDHLHGIIMIHKKPIPGKSLETLHATSLHADTTKSPDKMSAISPKTGSLSVIIRSYKSAVTNHVRKINPRFAWQSRYYEHIIKDMNDLERIRKYIRNNPDAQ